MYWCTACHAWTDNKPLLAWHVKICNECETPRESGTE